MKKTLIEWFIVYPTYLVLLGLRLIFLSSRFGVFIHNAFYYLVFRPMADKGPRTSRILSFLGRSLKKETAIPRWQRRIYMSTPAAYRHALKNVFARKFLVGTLTRRNLTKCGHAVPDFIAISLNTPENSCNLACLHCYATGHANESLDFGVLKRITEEQEELGIFTIMFLGGEPFRYEKIWEIFESYPKTTFYVSTNGVLLSDEDLSKIASLGNVGLMFSLEGFEETTDRFRGVGVYGKIIDRLECCRDLGLPYGVTLTVTRQNLQEVTSCEFLANLNRLRCCAVNYSCYIPIGRSPHPEWQISDAESCELDWVIDFVHDNFPMMPTIGRNGTNRVNNCSAARHYLHILPDGRVEPCPFAQWANCMNIKDYSILEITASPFFAGIREITALGIPGITPCQAPKLSTLRSAFVRLGAKPTI